MRKLEFVASVQIGLSLPKLILVKYWIFNLLSSWYNQTRSRSQEIQSSWTAGSLILYTPLLLSPQGAYTPTPPQYTV